MHQITLGLSQSREKHQRSISERCFALKSSQTQKCICSMTLQSAPVICLPVMHSCKVWSCKPFWCQRKHETLFPVPCWLCGPKTVQRANSWALEYKMNLVRTSKKKKQLLRKLHLHEFWDHYEVIMSLTHLMRCFINGLMEEKKLGVSGAALDNGYRRWENVVWILLGYLNEMRMNEMVWTVAHLSRHPLYFYSFVA